MEDLGICCRAGGGRCPGWLVRAVLIPIPQRQLTEQGHKDDSLPYARGSACLGMGNAEKELRDISHCSPFRACLLGRGPTGAMKPGKASVLNKWDGSDGKHHCPWQKPAGNSQQCPEWLREHSASTGLHIPTCLLRVNRNSSASRCYPH